jgi:hypothetical protein
MQKEKEEEGEFGFKTVDLNGRPSKQMYVTYNVARRKKGQGRGTR